MNCLLDLHSLWDGLLIAKALRSIPSNYTRPLPVPGIEANLRDTIYDPFIRKIMWEGLGVGPPPAKFADVGNSKPRSGPNVLNFPNSAPPPRSRLTVRSRRVLQEASI